MKKNFNSGVLVLLLFLLSGLGCAGVPTTRFVNPDFNFGFVEKVAVLPFENLSTDQQAGVRATRLFITELLASSDIEVVESGEVSATLGKIGVVGSRFSREQVMAVAKLLEVQAVVVGSVNESTTFRSGTVQVPVVTLDVHMLDGETGTAVWAGTHTEKGSGMGAKLLGTGSEPKSETTRKCVRKLIRELVR